MRKTMLFIFTFAASLVLMVAVADAARSSSIKREALSDGEMARVIEKAGRGELAIINGGFPKTKAILLYDRATVKIKPVKIAQWRYHDGSTIYDSIERMKQLMDYNSYKGKRYVNSRGQEMYLITPTFSSYRTSVPKIVVRDDPEGFSVFLPATVQSND